MLRVEAQAEVEVLTEEVGEAAQVIVCIDSDASTSQVREVIEGQNFTGKIEVFASLAEATALLTEQNKERGADAIFCNFKLSDLDVINLLANGRLRKHSKIVVYSGLDLAFESYVKSKGAHAYLTLPFEQAKVAQILKELDLA